MMQLSIILVCLMPLMIQALWFGSKTTHPPVTTTTSPSALAALVHMTTSPSTTAFPFHGGTTSALYVPLDDLIMISTSKERLNVRKE
jgi:hypothetical protein